MARSLVSPWMVTYFAVLTVLASMAFIPDAITIGMLLFILPGMLLVVSPTLLIYSIGLLPAYLVNRHLEIRLLAGSVAVLGSAAVALLPHYAGGIWFGLFRAADVSYPPTSFQPRSFELPERVSGTHRMGLGSVPLCADLCQQLLFRGNVDQVFVFGDTSQDSFTHGSIAFVGEKAYFMPPGIRSFRPIDLPHDSSVQEIPVERANHPIQKWRRFRLQQQETCAATLSVIKYSQDGRCLIEEAADSADADVVLSISEVKTPPRLGDSTDPCQSQPHVGIQKGPITVTLAERRNGKLLPVERKTALEARYASVPFYFGVRSAGLAACLGVATETFPPSYADPFEMISRRYVLPVARTSG